MVALVRNFCCPAMTRRLGDLLGLNRNRENIYICWSIPKKPTFLVQTEILRNAVWIVAFSGIPVDVVGCEFGWDGSILSFYAEGIYTGSRPTLSTSRSIGALTPEVLMALHRPLLYPNVKLIACGRSEIGRGHLLLNYLYFLYLFIQSIDYIRTNNE